MQECTPAIALHDWQMALAIMHTVVSITYTSPIDTALPTATMHAHLFIEGRDDQQVRVALRDGAKVAQLCAVMLAIHLRPKGAVSG